MNFKNVTFYPQDVEMTFLQKSTKRFKINTNVFLGFTFSSSQMSVLMVARQRRRIPHVIPFGKLEGLELSRFTLCLSTQGRRKTRLPVETNALF